MLKDPNAILKLAVALAVLLAGAGIGFYFGIYLPSQDVRREARALAEKQVQQAAAAQALSQRAQREQAAQTEYQGCTDFAEQSYKQRWTAACQAQHDRDQAAYEDCADNLFSTQAGCMAQHPVRPIQDCALPAATAQTYAQARDARKQQCLAQLQSAQTGRPSAPMSAVPGEALPQPAMPQPETTTEL